MLNPHCLLCLVLACLLHWERAWYCSLEMGEERGFVLSQSLHWNFWPSSNNCGFWNQLHFIFLWFYFQLWCCKINLGFQYYCIMPSQRGLGEHERKNKSKLDHRQKRVAFINSEFLADKRFTSNIPRRSLKFFCLPCCSISWWKYVVAHVHEERWSLVQERRAQERLGWPRLEDVRHSSAL